MARRFWSVFGVGALALTLAACSSTAPKPSASAANSHGGYKVGNPYQIDGTWYYPNEDWSYDETGIASWYGEQFHGKYTANGETFDLNAMTAAHRTLPMPTVVRVTNLENGRSIEVRVNDRGPYARGRIIDMSRRAAQLLGYEGKGTAKVRVQIDVPASIQVASLAGRRGNEPALAAVAPKAPGDQSQQQNVAEAPPPAVPVEKVAAEALPPPPGVVAVAPPPTPTMPAPPPAPEQVALVEAPPLPETVKVVPVGPTNIYVQAGSFSSIDRAVRLKTLLDKLGSVTVTDTKVNGTIMYRVRLGPIGSVDQADALLSQVVNNSPEARIVVN